MKKVKGSYTIEAAIVMSTMIFIILAVVAGFMLIYQNAVLFSVATQAAQEGAIMWVDEDHSMWKHSPSGKAPNIGLYADVSEMFGGGVDERTTTIENWIKQKLKEMMPNTFVGSGKETINVELKRNLIQRYVEVTIKKEVNIPFKEIAQYYDMDLDMNVTARAEIADSAEFIRNVDYGLELAGDLWKMISDKVGGLLNSKKGG